MQGAAVFSARHPRTGTHLPWHQVVLRMDARLPGRLGAGIELDRSRPPVPPYRALHVLLFHDDGRPRAAHGGGRRHVDRADHSGDARALSARTSERGGDGRALLALRGHYLDLSLPAALFDRGALRWLST